MFNLLHIVELAELDSHRRQFEDERRKVAEELFKRNMLLWEREAAEEEGDMFEDVDGVAVRIRWRNPNLAPEDKPHDPEPAVKPLSELKPAPHAERPDLTVHHAHHSAHDAVVHVEDLALTH